MQIESWGTLQKRGATLAGTCLLPDSMIMSPLKKNPTPNSKHTYEVSLIHRGPQFPNGAEVQIAESIRK